MSNTSGCASAAKELVVKRHNKMVKYYFKDRPGDLLVMDITNGDGWELLCKFLKKPIPNKKVPMITESLREQISATIPVGTSNIKAVTSRAVPTRTSWRGFRPTVCTR